MVIPSSSLLLSVLLGWIGLEWVRRALWMRQLSLSNPPLRPVLNKDVALVPEKVSIIVPARNEEKNIAQCLFHLMRQDHPDFEIIVVDDRSDDRSPHLIENFKTLSSVPLKVIRIEKLPPGWTGKNHAMFAGSKAATGKWLLFTDADTTHTRHSVRTALLKAMEERIDLLTLAPEVECRSFWEHTVQPLAVSSLALWFNTVKLNDADAKKVLANGQFILVRKEVYEAVGGNEAVKTEVVEDVELAKKVKSAGFMVRFLNGSLLYSTRMYASLGQILNGWTRIFVHLFKKKIPPLLHKVFLFLFFSLLPFAVCKAEIFFWLAGDPLWNPLILGLGLAVSAEIILIRFVGNKMLRTNPWYAFLHPLSAMVMVWILLACVGRILLNKPSEWRGDRY